MSLKKWLVLAVALLFPTILLAGGLEQADNPLLPYFNIIAPNTVDGITVNPNNAAPGNFTTLGATGVFTTTGGANTVGTGNSTSLTGNPFTYTTHKNIPIATVNSQVQVLTGATGKTIYPVSIALQAVGGNLGTCTGIKVYCSGPSDADTLVGTFPAADMPSGEPLSVYSSTSTPGAPMTLGCTAGDSMYLSPYSAGNCTGATSIDALISYILP